MKALGSGKWTAMLLVFNLFLLGGGGIALGQETEEGGGEEPGDTFQVQKCHCLERDAQNKCIWYEQGDCETGPSETCGATC